MRSINEESIWPLLGILKGNLVKKLRVVQTRVLLCNINAKQKPPQIIRSYFSDTFLYFMVHFPYFSHFLFVVLKYVQLFQHRKQCFIKKNKRDIRVNLYK